MTGRHRLGVYLFGVALGFLLLGLIQTHKARLRAHELAEAAAAAERAEGDQSGESSASPASDGVDPTKG